MSFGPAKMSTQYYIGGALIQKVNKVRDLGVIFDTKLTFENHIDTITNRAAQMVGAARRFVRGINHPLLMRTIYMTYISPILEYESVIWNQNRVGLNNKIDDIYRQVTRAALSVPRNPVHIFYKSRGERARILALFDPDTRRKTSAALIGLKILKDEMICNIKQNLQSFIRNTNINTRSTKRFDSTFRRLPPKSPLSIIIDSLNHYEKAINLVGEVEWMKGRIKFDNLERLAAY